MKPLPTLHKEHFEFWLFAQPDEREWNYNSCTDCVGATFLRETTGTQTAWGNIFYSHPEYKLESQLIPDWLQYFFRVARMSGPYLGAAHLKRVWREMFPEPTETRPLTLTPAKEQVSA